MPILNGNQNVGEVFILLPLNSPPNQLIVSDPDPRVTETLDSDSFRSIVVSVSLASPLIQGSFSAEICLSVDQDEDIDDLCLGFFNEDTNSWDCEDECLETIDKEEEEVFDETKRKDDGTKQVCGTTDHFTNFAILLVGSNGVNGDPCSSSTNDAYFTGDWRGDLGVVGGFCLILLLCILIVVVLSYVRALRPLFFGDEGNRVKNLRSNLGRKHRELDDFTQLAVDSS